MKVSTRTRALLSWLPATALVLIIGAIVLGSFAMQQSWWVQPDRAPSDDQRATDGGSLFSDAGLDYVNVDGTLRVRLGDGGLPASQLGLSADGDRDATLRRPVRAVVATGDEVRTLYGIENLRVATAADGVTELVLSPAPPGDWIDARALLAQLAPDWGWDATTLDVLDEGLAEFTRDNTEGTFVAETAPAAADGGVEVVGRLIFDRASGGTGVELVFTVTG